MAKAVFHKHQRVFVRPVGTWALIEQVKPQWVKDVEEPVRIHYDCGLGRDFTAADLAAEQVEEHSPDGWRVLRAKNKWQTEAECAHHPFPGTYPVVVTDEQNWGGWRVPGAEYDRDPNKIEFQARLIEQAPALLTLAEYWADLPSTNPDLPQDLLGFCRHARDIVMAIRATTEEPMVLDRRESPAA
ncbi:hypothetical protein L5876_05650 [Hyphobacterium sp. SN044]|uniref:hypothetical protein n=1 Tax=Hyphobacterium sp. SN044 TaxID=2912575 RepID=UPI001F23CEA7|nr:hypothetical protein [Hyphobacterium sp. SN044]MCF8879295.1 hypothetical protein [Hyphobacterium sp. SN044]